MFFLDWENIVLLITLMIFFVMGLSNRPSRKEEWHFIEIDLPMTIALKGIACILILMGHYVKLRSNCAQYGIVTKFVYMTTANVALTLFMFFSGYGLSIQKKSGDVSSWIKRMKKVYLPLFYTCVLSLLLYCFLPDMVTKADIDSTSPGFVENIYMIHNFSIDYLWVLCSRALGWKDWFVFCIMVFYSLFYLSLGLSKNRTQVQTRALWLMLVGYFLLAYLYFGPKEAHWYRYCWAFFFGHINAKMVQGVGGKMDLIMFIALSLTIFIEPSDMILSYVIAISILFIVTRINLKYTMESRSLAFMGAISYFFYLSHIRISYTLLSFMNIYNMFFWIVLTVIVSYGLKISYSYILSKMTRTKGVASYYN